MKKKEEEKMKVTYHYIEPNTKEEKEKQEQSVSKAYELLFEATLESDEWKQNKAGAKDARND
jgi:hypothetical protein